MTYYIAEIRFNRKNEKPKSERKMKKHLRTCLITLLLACIVVVSTLIMMIPSTAGPNNSDQPNSITSLLGQLAGNVSTLSYEDFKHKNENSAAGKKGALLNKIGALISQIESGAYGGAKDKLINDIKEKILEWIDDECEIKDDLINLVNTIIEKIEEIIEGDLKPPEILWVWREPEKSEYEYNETVAVKAYVTDKGTGVEYVILSYWNGSAFENTTMIGKEPLYNGTIQHLPYGTTVEYWVNASDHAGNWVPESERKVYFYTVTDSYRPIARIDYPSEESFLAGEVNITIYAFDDNFVSANLTIDDKPVSSWESVGIHTYVWDTNSPQYPDGEHTIELTANDIAGNNCTAGITVTVDNTPPLAVINAPTEGSYVKGTVIVDVTGTDENFEEMGLSIDGTLVESWSISGSHPYGWDTMNYPDGSHTLTLTIYDKAGNINETDVTVTMDNTLPALSIVSPSSGDFLKGTVLVELTGNDDNFDKMELYFDDTLVETFSTSGTNTYTWNTLTYTDGVHTISLAVNDKAGNSATDVITVTIDNTSPVGEISKPAADIYLRGLNEVSVYGSDANFKQMELYIDDDLVKTWTETGAQTYTWNTETFEDGSRTLKLAVRDKAENTVEKTATVTVDNTDPEIGAPTWEPEEPSADEQVNVMASVSDAGGVKNVTLWYNVTGEWLPLEMTSANVNWTATIPGQSSDTTVLFYVEAYDKAGNNNMTTMYEYTVKAPSGWPLAWLAGIALGVAALTGTGVYALYRRRKKKSAESATKSENKPVVSFYVPAKILTRDEQTPERDE